MANLKWHYYGTGGKTKRGVYRNPASEWWSMLDLNQRPPACEAGALPTELIDRDEKI
jgi:hypothetical protein